MKVDPVLIAEARKLVRAGMSPRTAKYLVDHVSVLFWIKVSRKYVSAMNYRLAFEAEFHAMTGLMMERQWTAVSEELKIICSSPFLVDFGVGVLRFVSSAADQIPDWNTILDELRIRAHEQNLDVARVFRGIRNSR